MTRPSWIGAKPPAKGTVQPRRPTAEGASFRTLLRARGISPAGAFVEGMTDEACVLRSVVWLDVDSPIEFDAIRADGSTYAAHGRIRSRVSVPPRFEYDVQIERSNIPVVADRSPETGMRRRLRLEIQFALQYRTPKEGFKNASASNVSTGGLLMTCTEALVKGTLLEVHFALPSDVLNVYPSKTTVLDIRAGFKRRVVPSKHRRPFDDIVAVARVVHHRPLSDGRYAFGLSFTGLDRHTREEIARFVEARSVKLRKKP